MHTEKRDFNNGWDWARVFRYWKQSLNKFKLTPDNLFQTVKVYSPKSPNGDRPSIVDWWRVEDVKKNHIELQWYFYGKGYIPSFTRLNSSGTRDTIGYLYEHKDDPETVAAILIEASFFSRIKSSRSRYPEIWPKRKDLQELLAWVDQKFEGWWAHTCTEVLPMQSSDDEYRIESIEALIRYLAEEHAVLLLNYRPVIIEFCTAPDAEVDEILQARIIDEEKRRVAYEAALIEANIRKKAAEEEMLLKHPRHEEWYGISAKELERAVWSKSTVKLAVEFNVSDVAIGKKCKAMGIRKPPAGFWAKVDAGKIPHPNGIPVDVKELR